MTDEDFEELREDMDGQGEWLRESLADDLDGDPEDYRVERTVATDGGEE